MHKHSERIRVAVVGLGFGGEFPAIYAAHPDVEWVAVCDRDHQRLSRVAERTGIARCFPDYEDVLACDDIDAVHILSGIPDHAAHTLAALRAGKHCACTVPMATELSDLHAIVEEVRSSGLSYMMMETSVFAREFLHVSDLAAAGRLGRLQFLRGAHYQDMEQWPSYWAGLPPMHYSTHAVGPCLALAGSRAVEVHAYGSGWMRDELHRQYGNPFPVETAIFRLEQDGLAMEITRSLFHVGRGYTEMFNVYGENGVFEWPQLEGKDAPVLFEMAPYEPGKTRPCRAERIDVPDFAERLPASIRRFTQRHSVEDKNHKSFTQGGGHGGSHPHLVHEFVRSIIEGRKPLVDDVTAANWTAAGICAHASAMAGGDRVTIPSFDG